MKTTIGDKILIISLSLFSIFLAIFISSNAAKSDSAYINIRINGEDYKKIEFTDEIVGNTYEIQTEFGRNVLEIGENSVRVIEADCPDELDVKQGWIHKPGEVLVCLPNRMIVEIVADDPQEEAIDSFNY